MEITEVKEKREVLLERHKHWSRPEPKEGSYRTGLKLHNSLWPVEPVEFVPKSGRTVTWYSCGPTVYSDTHLGHARCYVVADFLRRVMRDYFHYDVNYVMNITDIDDKIINKSIELGVDFNEFARKWEKDYFENMKSLGVEPPNRIVRVTEYVPEIVKFIEKIIANGYAYESNGSVYFNVEEFRKRGHHYCKLEPTSYNPDNTDGENNNDKKSSSDFALWKKAKEGEPTWPSPWGQGRPGWHIECSCMVDEAFGNIPTIDVHYGGSDLKFPHHDNEIAQSEAFYDNQQWINYFLHVGQLYIKGLKMSKSLKNYLTVKDILTNEEDPQSPRAMRLLFLIHRWDSILNFDGPKSFEEVSAKDKTFHNFVLNAQVFLRRGLVLNQSQKFDAEENKFDKELYEKQSVIHEHLCNSIDTPSVIEELLGLVKNMNVYFKRDPAQIKTTLVQNYYEYVLKMLSLFGLEYRQSETSQASNQEAFNGIVDVIRDYRDNVIIAAGQKDPKLLFDLSDKLRDEILPPHGIKIEDKGKGKASTWIQQSPEQLLKEIAAKKLEAQKAKEEKERRAKELEDKQKRDPREIFDDEEYKKFSIGQKDEKGIPTHNLKGEAFPAKVRDKFEKEYAKQEKSRQEWLAKQKQE